MSERLRWINAELQALEMEGLLRRRREVLPISGGKLFFDGKRAWDFSSNDYLGLANDPQVIAAAENELRQHGVGSKASPLVSGRTNLHAALERALAEFEGTEAAILFPTGMAANLGTVPALASEGDAIFCDRLNHASLVDGSRTSGARLRVYRHNDLAGLNESLGRESARRKFIVTDSVFSMDGDLAPLPELCELADRHGAEIIIDEAHGTGVFGKMGRGVAEFQGVEDRIAVRIGTLSKAIGTLGGFVSGDQNLIDFLWNKARTHVYSTGLPAVICAAATVAVRIIQNDPSRRERLHVLARSFREQLIELGVSPLAGSVGPIVPIVLNEPRAAVHVAELLLDDGFLVSAIRPPTVPRGTSRLRVTLHANDPPELASELATKIAAAVSKAGLQR